MPPEELLLLAEKLADGTSEAEYRCAARLAYYAVYHLMAAYLGLDPMKWATANHEAVRTALFRISPAEADPGAQAARQRWDRLKAERVRADYWLNEKFDKRRALISVIEARRIFDARTGRFR